jgi:ABC-2 type transport system ATP-binding protein
MHVLLERVVVTFSGHEALNVDSLRVSAGVTALIGPNGAGKSTLLRCVATVLEPTRGHVVWGDSLDLPEARLRLGYLPQTVRFPPRFRVVDAVRYAGWCHGLPSAEAWAAAEEALEVVDLLDVRHRRVHRLSGGMRQRLGIAQAIVHRPTLLVLDEPSSGLDPGQRETFRSLLRRLGHGATVLVSTHLVDDVAAVADRVLFLNAGRIVQDASVQAILQPFGQPAASPSQALTDAYHAAMGAPGGP